MSELLAVAGGATSPLAGVGNLFSHESRTWWRKRRWWTQLLLWTALLVGTLKGLLWVAANAEVSIQNVDPGAVDAAAVFPQFVGFAITICTIGVVVLTQGMMLDERRLGTLEWLLVKPVRRSGVVLAKYLANLLPVWLVFVLGPWTGLYVLLSLERGAAWPLGSFLAAAGLAALVHAFTVALVLALGTWFNSRSAVIGLPIGAIFLYDFVPMVLPATRGRLPMPWELVSGIVHVSAGESLISTVPVFATLVWIVALLAAAAWHFERQEVL